MPLQRYLFQKDLAKKSLQDTASSFGIQNPRVDRKSFERRQRSMQQ
jgi:hypothetical protein